MVLKRRHLSIVVFGRPVDDRSRFYEVTLDFGLKGGLFYTRKNFYDEESRSIFAITQRPLLTIVVSRYEIAKRQGSESVFPTNAAVTSQSSTMTQRQKNRWKNNAQQMKITIDKQRVTAKSQPPFLEKRTVTKIVMTLEHG